MGGSARVVLIPVTTRMALESLRGGGRGEGGRGRGGLGSVGGGGERSGVDVLGLNTLCGVFLLGRRALAVGFGEGRWDYCGEEMERESSFWRYRASRRRNFCG